MGHSGHTNMDFALLINETPHQIQNLISCPYEAFQYLNAINFEEAKDVYYKTENNVNWEYHIDGLTAIRNKRGCCTSVASAATFLLSKCFQKMGYIFFVRPDTSNHALNYVYHRNKYFIFDASAYTYGQLDYVAIENGDINSIKDKIITSICFETSSLYDFVKFHKRVHLYNSHRFLYLSFPKSDNCLDRISLKKENNKLSVYLPKEKKFELLDAVDEMQYNFCIV